MRSFISLLCVIVLVGCVFADISRGDSLQKNQPLPVLHIDGRLKVREDFANNIQKILYFLHPERTNRFGSVQYVMNTPQVRELLQIHPDAIADYDLRASRGNISLTRSIEYNIPAYTKQCIGFIKAIITDSNWTIRDLRGAKTPISSENLPRQYDIIGYFSGGIDENGYGTYRSMGSHLAVYLGTYENGIIVLDQNHNGEGSLAVRKLPWDSHNKRESFLGAKYYRIVMK